jgi:hypothetical protein
VLIVPPDQAEIAAALLVERFDVEAPHLYDSNDADRGTIEVKDRQGTLRKFPLLTLSVGIATTLNRHFSHYGEAVAVATEMKQFAKRQPGSSFAVDRRTS